jgi:P4 family phage/plasmid primase-like protien
VETLSALWEEKGFTLLHTNGAFYKYESGFWKVCDADDLGVLEGLIYDHGNAEDFPFSEKWGPLWRTIKGHFSARDKIVFDQKPAVALLNGTFFLETDRLRKHSPKHHVTKHLPIEYDPKADCPQWLAMLERIFEDYGEKDRAQLIRFLQEWFGVSIVGGDKVRNNRNLKKGVFLKGPPRTGKSTIAEVLRTMMGGIDRCCSSSIDTMAKGEFGMQPLIGKSALISDDGISQATKAPPSLLKILITSDWIVVNRKNKDPIQFRFDGPVMFTCNNLPKLNDIGDAVYDRYVVIETNRAFDSKDIKKTLSGYTDGVSLLVGEGEIPGILNWAIDGYDAAVERGSLSLPQVSKSATLAFRRSNDVIFDFLSECCDFDEGVSNVCSLVSGVASEYALSNHGVRIGIKSAGNSLVETVRNVFPAVKVAQVSYGTLGQERSYVGLKLNERGIAYKERAIANEVATVKMHRTKVNVNRRGI